MAARRNPVIAWALGRVAAMLGDSLPGPHTNLLVACSGGADSVAMLGLLRLMANKRKWSLFIGHIHHGLRQASDGEAERVVALGQQLGVPVRVTRLELEAGPGLPARARDARRAALAGLADEFGAPFVALGHTATDQTETVLMHLTRGAGLDGLAAMPVCDGRWLRPVLGISRAKTRELCELFAFPFVDDPTNRDHDHLRVRIREVVLPLLRGQNPRLDDAVGSLARVARDADVAIAEWVSREVQERHQGPNSWRIDRLGSLPRAIRTGFIREVCRLAGAGPEACGHRKVAEIERAIVVVERTRGTSSAARKPRVWQLSGGYQLCVDVSGLHLTDL